MELAACHVVLGHEGRDLTAIVRARDKRATVRRHKMIGVHEIGVKALLSGGDALKQGMRACHLQRVPPHMRDLERRVAWFDRPDLALDPTKPRREPLLEPTLCHELKSHADAEKGLAALLHCLV